jgi:hypothetical protein
MEGNPSIVLNVLPISIGRFSAVPHWPLLGVPRGSVDRTGELAGHGLLPIGRRENEVAFFFQRETYHVPCHYIVFCNQDYSSARL